MILREIKNMTLDEIEDGDFFMFEDRAYKATRNAQGYKRLCVCLYDGKMYAIDRDVEVEKIL